MRTSCSASFKHAPWIAAGVAASTMEAQQPGASLRARAHGLEANARCRRNAVGRHSRARSASPRRRRRRSRGPAPGRSARRRAPFAGIDADEAVRSATSPASLGPKRVAKAGMILCAGGSGWQPASA